MFANRVLVVCGVLLMFACLSARAEDKAPKKYAIQFKDAKWDDVLDWYAKESGLVLVTTAKPTGTFTFVPSKPGQRYTLGEITDILNNGMMQQKFILIRRKMTFFTQDWTEKFEPRDRATLFKKRSLAELAELDRTELVEVEIPVGGLDVGEVKDELAKLLSPFGEIMTAEGARLVVRDVVGNVVRIRQTLDT